MFTEGVVPSVGVSGRQMTLNSGKFTRFERILRAALSPATKRVCLYPSLVLPAFFAAAQRRLAAAASFARAVLLNFRTALADWPELLALSRDQR